MDIVVCLPRHTPTTFPQNPLDRDLNIAVRHIASVVCPAGWNEVEKFEDAPTTLQAVTEYAKREGRLCIATEDSSGTIYDCEDTNVHLRAWHDSLHFRHQLGFHTAGEAAATYVMVAQLCHLYGTGDRSIKWASLILADILGLVLHYQRTRKFPKNKRAGTINEQKKWVLIAKEIAEHCTGKDHEAKALSLSARTWGGYAEVLRP